MGSCLFIPRKLLTQGDAQPQIEPLLRRIEGHHAADLFRPRQERAAAENVTVTEADTAFLNAFSAKIALLGTEEESAAQGKLEDTEPVVCAGLGISTQENRDKLNELAAPLRAQQVTAYRHDLWRGADRRAAACR